MKILRASLHVACLSILCSGLGAMLPSTHGSCWGQLLAQSPAGETGSVEVEATLFVQAPEHDNGHGGIVVVWLPKPLERYCMGKTHTQCANIDYCIRTTNRAAAMCRNIGVNLAQIPRYPANTRPRRMQSILLTYLTPDKFPTLQEFYRSAPRESLERLSMSARVKARLLYTNKPDDDSIELLDIVAVPPF